MDVNAEIADLERQFRVEEEQRHELADDQRLILEDFAHCAEADFCPRDTLPRRLVRWFLRPLAWLHDRAELFLAWTDRQLSNAYWWSLSEEEREPFREYPEG